MKLGTYLKMILSCLSVIIIVFTVVSLIDILIAVVYSRFYSNAAFVVSFGVGGIFGAVFGYFSAIDHATRKDESARWTIISTLIICGIVFFFLLARLEGGEYEPAFKAYGATLALGSLLFIKGKVD